MEDDLAIPMDFSGRVNMYKGCVVLFVQLNLIAHSIISHAVYFIVLLLPGLFEYETVTHPAVNMSAPRPTCDASNHPAGINMRLERRFC